ncbi:MAG: CubicO group peptidase (beta-lactamase class C family) [Saprospiraceae bacterium]|jgi:CubicO group peptidase (beta-lactamase class C family)
MKKICFLFLSITLISNTFAQHNKGILSEINIIENALSKYIQLKSDSNKTFSILDRMAFYNVPGVSIAVVVDGEIRWSKGYGYANTATGTKVDSGTLFQAGSISKPIAALAALKLFENDSLELNEDVNHYLKNWQVPENKYTKTEKVTLEKLLTHTAGTTVHGFPGYKQTDKFPKIIDVLNGKGNTSKIEVDTIPGSIWRYSGGGYCVMQKVIEDVSGLSFADYMSRNILLPIGMKNSTYQQPIPKEWHSNISAAYNTNGKLINGLWNNYPEQAAAGLWTTASDLAMYCIEIQHIAEGKGDGILTKKTVDMMLTKHKNGWGLGPSLLGEKDSLTFGHGGKNAGFTNEMLAYAYQKHAIVVMTNGDNGSKLTFEIINAISTYYGLGLNVPMTIIEAIELPDSILKEYAGKYELKKHQVIEVVELKGNQLILPNSPFGSLKLIPLTETKFIDIGSGTTFEFSIDGLIINNAFKFEKMER